MSAHLGEESKARLGAIFLMHQIIGIWVTIRSAPILTASAVNLLRLLGFHLTKADYYWVLNGTPYFPVQIGEGLLLGWILGRYLRHRSMLWVWVLPFIYLCYAIVAIPTLNPDVTPPAFQAGIGQSRLTHYLGWGCQPVNHCYDQEVVTSLAYAAGAYSLGAFAAEKLTEANVSATLAQFSLVLAVGTLFLAGAVYDLYKSAQIVWTWRLVPVEATPAAMGAYLILLAFTIRFPQRPAGPTL
jgi:hypothetical protein